VHDRGRVLSGGGVSMLLGLPLCSRRPSLLPRSAAGCVVPELLDGTNHIAWFKAGEQIFTKNGIQYLGIPGFINARSIIATLIVQVRRQSVHSWYCAALVCCSQLDTDPVVSWGVLCGTCCGCSRSQQLSRPLRDLLQVILMGWVEGYRYSGDVKGLEGLDQLHPGGAPQHSNLISARDPNGPCVPSRRLQHSLTDGHNVHVSRH
jgi:hypothetical protein